MIVIRAGSIGRGHRWHSAVGVVGGECDGFSGPTAGPTYSESLYLSGVSAGFSDSLSVSRAYRGDTPSGFDDSGESGWLPKLVLGSQNW